jgi:hypothetical protein
LLLTGRTLGQVFNSRSVCLYEKNPFLVTKRTHLKFKTQPPSICPVKTNSHVRICTALSRMGLLKRTEFGKFGKSAKSQCIIARVNESLTLALPVGLSRSQNTKIWQTLFHGFLIKYKFERLFSKIVKIFSFLVTAKSFSFWYFLQKKKIVELKKYKSIVFEIAHGRPFGKIFPLKHTKIRLNVVSPTCRFVSNHFANPLVFNNSFHQPQNKLSLKLKTILNGEHILRRQNGTFLK